MLYQSEGWGFVALVLFGLLILNANIAIDTGWLIRFILRIFSVSAC